MGFSGKQCQHWDVQISTSRFAVFCPLSEGPRTLCSQREIETDCFEYSRSFCSVHLRPLVCPGSLFFKNLPQPSKVPPLDIQDSCHRILANFPRQRTWTNERLQRRIGNRRMTKGVVTKPRSAILQRVCGRREGTDCWLHNPQREV